MITITQSTPQVQTRTVIEYALTVHNAKDNDTQNLSAAFTHILHQMTGCNGCLAGIAVVICFQMFLL